MKHRHDQQSCWDNKTVQNSSPWSLFHRRSKEQTRESARKHLSELIGCVLQLNLGDSSTGWKIASARRPCPHPCFDLHRRSLPKSKLQFMSKIVFLAALCCVSKGTKAFLVHEKYVPLMSSQNLCLHSTCVQPLIDNLAILQRQLLNGYHLRHNGKAALSPDWPTLPKLILVSVAWSRLGC